MRSAGPREPTPDRYSPPWIKPFLVIVLIALSAWIVQANHTELQGLIAGAEVAPLLVALAFGMVGQFLNAWIAKISLANEDIEVPVRVVYRILAVGGMAKYVPGGVWQLASQIGVGRIYGIRARGAVLAWVEPTAFNVTIGGGLAFLIAAANGYQLHPTFFVVAGVTLLTLSIEPIRGRAYRLLRLTTERPRRHLRRWIARAGTTALIVLTTGAAGMAVIAAFPVDDQPTLLQSSAAFTGAWVIGVLAFPIPGGLGVREGALVLALSPWMPGHQALVVAAASRLVGVVGEAASGLLSVAIPDPTNSLRKPADIVYIGSLPPLRGGVSQHGDRLIRSLQESGRSVTAVSWRSAYPAVIYPGKTESVESPTHVLRWWSISSWLAARAVASTARTVIVPWVTAFQALPLWVMLRGLRAVRIVVVHNAAPHERFPLSQALTRWVLRQADVVACLSETVAHDVKQLTGRSAHVLPHPSNLSLSPQPLGSSPVTRLLFLGYVRPYKGLDILLRALSFLDQSRFRLTVAGEAWEATKTYEALASELGLTDAVAFRFGYVPESELAGLLADHDLVVQSYRSASQSGVVPLAHAAGRAVVVTPVGGLVEQVADGVNGIVARSVDPRDVAEAIQRAADDLSTLTGGAASTTSNWASVVSALEALEQLARRGKDSTEP